MQASSKNSTDIDRKLAIYYHPLFQQIIKIILNLFQSDSSKFEVGLLEFVQFNLKLQKALLPSFQVDNALISGLNDWVKQVAQCLTYEGMVSTSGCVEVTSANILQLIQKAYNQSNIKFFQKKQKYLQILNKVSSHDAFKLLGVKINRQVFSKFMFDLCSTWCQFLDVQLFSYFLIGLYIQISQGETIEGSKFKNTFSINTIQLQFMEQFQEIKSTYGKIRRKQLRYYRAWCEWNYLRVNEAGERLILKLDQIHHQDNRILQLAMVFQRAIQVINQQITSQNPKMQEKKPKKVQAITQKQVKQQQQNKDFLILKKLNIQPNSKQQAKLKQQENMKYTNSIQEQAIRNSFYQRQTTPQQFQIQIDEQGNMYLKRIVKLPIFGIKIQPKPFNCKHDITNRELIEQKNNQYRQVSNLYGKFDSMKIRLQHNVRNDPYTFKKSLKIQERDNFYLQQKNQNKRNHPVDSTIHQKVTSTGQNKQKQQQKIIQIPIIKREEKVSLRQNKQYNYKVMAPTFLTDHENNLCYAQKKQGQIYSSSAHDEKRQIKIGLPKLKHMEFRVKQMKSYHIVGKLVSDRSVINEKVRSASIDMTRQTQKTVLESLKQQNKHIWSRYMEEQEVKQMNNYREFYKRLQEAKKQFGQQFQSEYRQNLKPILAYENKRHEIGGILTKEDQQRFSQRIQKLINKQNRKKGNKKRMRKQKLRQYRKSFKSKKERSLYQDIFINYHKEAIADIKKNRDRHNSFIVK